MTKKGVLRDDGDMTRVKIMNFVREYWTDNCHSPSIREITEHLGISAISVVNYHLGVLRGQGDLREIEPDDRGHSRNIIPADIVVGFKNGREDGRP